MIPANEMMRKGRKQLIEILEEDSDLVLEELFSESVITEEEYETCNKIREDSKRSRKLLLLIQKKGEMACCQFLEHLEIACPGSKRVLQRSVHCESYLKFFLYLKDLHMTAIFILTTTVTIFTLLLRSQDCCPH